MKIEVKSLFAAAVLFFCLASAVEAAEKVRIAGDPCSLPLMQKIVDAYQASAEKKLEVEYSTVGCMMGVYMAANQQYDVGVSTQNGLASNLPKGANLTVIGRAPIVLLAHKSNPVSNLSYSQLQKIFSGEITNWKEVGGKDLAIKNVMLEPCVKHTMSKKVIPYGEGIEQLKPEKKVNPVVYTNVMVSENEGAIGQQLYGYETGDVKLLTVDGILPDDKTVGGGEYTFFEEYNIVTRGEPNAAIKSLIDFAAGPEGAKVMQGMKHVPKG